MITFKILKKKCWLDDLFVSSCMPASCNSRPAPLTVVGALMTMFSVGAKRLERRPAVIFDADDEVGGEVGV